MSIQWNQELYHYGIPRRSGRYKWGSGKDPYHHGESIPKKIKKAYAKTALSVTKVSSKPIGAGLQTAVAVGNAAGKAQQTARNGISKGAGAVNKARDNHKAKIESMTPEERKARRDRNIKIAAGLGITLATAYTAKKLYDNQELRDVINNYKTIQREMPPQSSKAAATRRQLLRTGIKDSISDDRQRIRNERKEFVNSAARKASESVRSKMRARRETAEKNYYRNKNVVKGPKTVHPEMAKIIKSTWNNMAENKVRRHKSKFSAAADNEASIESALRGNKANKFSRPVWQYSPAYSNRSKRVTNLRQYPYSPSSARSVSKRNAQPSSKRNISKQEYDRQRDLRETASRNMRDTRDRMREYAKKDIREELSGTRAVYKTKKKPKRLR